MLLLLLLRRPTRNSTKCRCWSNNCVARSTWLPPFCLYCSYVIICFLYNVFHIFYVTFRCIINDELTIIAIVLYMHMFCVYPYVKFDPPVSVSHTISYKYLSDTSSYSSCFVMIAYVSQTKLTKTKYRNKISNPPSLKGFAI